MGEQSASSFTGKGYETMNLNKLTEKAQEAVVEAQSLAEEQHSSQIDDLHLLLALLNQEGGLTGAILSKLNVDGAGLRARAEAELGRMPKAYGSNQQPALSAETRATLQRANKEAERL